MRPFVERAAGRTMVDVPPIRWGTREAAEAEAVDARRWALVHIVGLGEDQAEEALKGYQAIPDSAMGYYSPLQRHIELLREPFMTAAQRGIAPDALAALVDCVVSHELVHATSSSGSGSGSSRGGKARPRMIGWMRSWHQRATA